MHLKKQNIMLCVSYFQTHDDFKVDIMDMRDMSDIGSLFGTGKDEQRTSPEEPGYLKNLHTWGLFNRVGVHQKFVL